MMSKMVFSVERYAVLSIDTNVSEEPTAPIFTSKGTK
jgi:hypothetical protein